jgi:hypothetical protein
MERQGSRLYSGNRRNDSDEQVGNIVRHVTHELRDASKGKREPLRLSDTERVKERTLEYLGLCEVHSTLPTMTGLARAFGMTSEALYLHMKNNPRSATTEWLKMAREAFADMMAAAALHGDAHPIFSIFCLKATHGWRDTVTIETATEAVDNLAVSEEEAARLIDKYSEALEIGGEIIE